MLFPGKRFISTILEMLEYKAEMTGAAKRRYLMRSGMAGIIVGLFYVGNYSLQAAFDSIEISESLSLLPLGQILGSTFFGFALVFIYYSKSELLTSNMMITSIGFYHHRITVWRSFRVLSMCYVGNFFGGLFVALLSWFSTFISPAVLVLMEHSVHTKLAYISDGPGGWGDLLVRAIFCNFFINLAMLMVYNGYIKDDMMKGAVMIVSVFVFAYLGFEHSVANTVLFTIMGVHESIDVGLATANVAICLLGNFIGGGVLIGLYYAYLNDHARFLRKHPEFDDGAEL